MHERTHPTFHGDGGTLFGIHFKNLLLTIITLGIYSFWAKADVRQYLYAQTSVAGDRFAYAGTGSELFRGFLKAFGLVFLGFLIAAVLAVFVSELVSVIVGYGIIGLFIFPLAVVGSRRYRLSRTSWRGIKFSFRGDYVEFLLVFIPGLLLTIISLGLYYPFFHADVRRFVVRGTSFGNQSFEFTGTGGDLFLRHLLLYVALPLTLGFYWFWHVSHRHRYYWEHTRFGSARFSSTMTGGDLLPFSLVNLLLAVVTLGIAFPWIQARSITFQCERLGIDGMEAFDTALQAADDVGVTGEGVAELFELDLAGADLFGL